MKILQKVVLFIALMILISSCKSDSDTGQILSKKDARKVIIDSIANNSEMTKEMMEAMMNNKNGKMMIQGNEKMTSIMMENRSTMMKMLKNNPDMMKRMLADMLETAKSDSVMMYGMYQTMLGNQQMMNMMQKMK